MLPQGERPMRLLAAATIAASLILSTGAAGAAELVVSQKKKRFDPKLLNAELGDTLVLVNDDRYAHNLFSETPGFEFNVRKQMPGDTHRMALDKSGKFEIRCVIHPRMRMTVIVE